MSQFTADSLARLLANVEREVLVDALEIANLTQLLPLPALQTLDEVAGWLNLAANLLVLGESVRDEAARRVIDDLLRQAKPGFGVGKGLMTVLGFFWKLEESITEIQQLIPEFEPAVLTEEDLVDFKGDIASLVFRALAEFTSISRETRREHLTSEEAIAFDNGLTYIQAIGERTFKL